MKEPQAAKWTQIKQEEVAQLAQWISKLFRDNLNEFAVPIDTLCLLVCGRDRFCCCCDFNWAISPMGLDKEIHVIVRRPDTGNQLNSSRRFLFAFAISSVNEVRSSQQPLRGPSRLHN